MQDNSNKTCHACLASIEMHEKKCPYCGEKQLSAWEYKLGRKLQQTFKGLYPASKILLIVLILIFIFMSIDILTTANYGLKEALLMPPSEIVYRWGAHLRGDLVWWRLITANFIHIGILHIVFNAYALRYVSPYVERAYGASLTFVSFLIAGTGSMLMSNLFGHPGLVAGASGGLMGFIGLAAVSAHRENTALSLEVRNSMLKWAASVMIFGLAASYVALMGIDNIAHASGFFIGALLGCILPTQSTTGFTHVRTIRIARLCCLIAILTTITAFCFMGAASVSNQYQTACVSGIKLKSFGYAQENCKIAYRTDKSQVISYHNYILINLINGHTDEAKRVCKEGRKRFKNKPQPLSFDEMCKSIGQ